MTAAPGPRSAPFPTSRTGYPSGSPAQAAVRRASAPRPGHAHVPGGAQGQLPANPDVAADVDAIADPHPRPAAGVERALVAPVDTTTDLVAMAHVAGAEDAIRRDPLRGRGRQQIDPDRAQDEDVAIGAGPDHPGELGADADARRENDPCARAVDGVIDPGVVDEARPPDGA